MVEAMSFVAACAGSSVICALVAAEMLVSSVEADTCGARSDIQRVEADIVAAQMTFATWRLAPMGSETDDFVEIETEARLTFRVRMTLSAKLTLKATEINVNYSCGEGEQGGKGIVLWIAYAFCGTEMPYAHSIRQLAYAVCGTEMAPSTLRFGFAMCGTEIGCRGRGCSEHDRIPRGFLRRKVRVLVLPYALFPMFLCNSPSSYTFYLVPSC